CGIAWCHGAPGIGLGRLRSLPYLNDDAARAEIDAALETTLREGFGLNHSLCHGDLGNLELLLQAADTLAAARWRPELSRVTAMLLESIERRGPLCAAPGGVETPGLMLGLGGIGYQLLRAADPGAVPSLLALAPPVSGI